MSADYLAPSRSHVVLYDRGLNGGYGATRIMANVTPETTHLVLSHNRLGDGGARMLFHLLKTQCEANIREIELNNCDIGDDGLRWIGEYLSGNTTLERLCLNGNRFNGDETIVTDFVHSLNQSVLRQLSLSTNSGLGDSFLLHFLPSLNSPHLNSLHMSMIGLTAASVPLLTAFLSSPGGRRIDLLTLNANSLGYRGVQEIIAFVETRVTALQVLELDGNSIEGEEESADGARKWTTKLRAAMLRNSMLKAQVRTAALRTLRSGRILLNAKPSPSATSTPPYLTLPSELHLLILRRLTDPHKSLSDRQFARVAQYATSWSEEAKALPGGGAGRSKWLEEVGCMYYEREWEREAAQVPESVQLSGY